MTVIAPPATDADFRAAIAAALDGTEWFVNSTPVDAIEPPCYMVVPSNRVDWFTPETVCAYRDVLDVAVIVGRIDLAPSFDMLAEGVSFALPRLREARLAAGVVQSASPINVGGLDYLAARITCSVSLVMEGT